MGWEKGQKWESAILRDCRNKRSLNLDKCQGVENMKEIRIGEWSEKGGVGLWESWREGSLEQTKLGGNIELENKW